MALPMVVPVKGEAFTAFGVYSQNAPRRQNGGVGKLNGVVLRNHVCRFKLAGLCLLGFILEENGLFVF